MPAAPVMHPRSLWIIYNLAATQFHAENRASERQEWVIECLIFVDIVNYSVIFTDATGKHTCPKTIDRTCFGLVVWVGRGRSAKNDRPGMAVAVDRRRHASASNSSNRVALVPFEVRRVGSHARVNHAASVLGARF